jgi:hypothetical protein
MLESRDSHGSRSDPDGAAGEGGATSPSRFHIVISVAVGIAVLAILNLAEVLFPGIKPFTFPAMVVGLVFVVGAHYLYVWRERVQRLSSLRGEAPARAIKVNGNDHGPLDPQ